MPKAFAFGTSDGTEVQYKVEISEVNVLWQEPFGVYTSACSKLSEITTDEEWKVI